jgi:hypothetical protein
MQIHTPPNEYPLDTLYVALSRDDKGNEGIISWMSDMGAMPIVFGNIKMIERLEPILKQMSAKAKQKIYIVKYTNKEDLKVIDATQSEFA